MAKSNAKRPSEVDRADREPTPRTPGRAAAPGPRATPKTANAGTDDAKRPAARAITSVNESPAAPRAASAAAADRNGQNRDAGNRDNSGRASAGRGSENQAKGEKRENTPRESSSREAAPRASTEASKPTRRELDAAESVRMEKADIGLDNTQRAGVSRILNKALSDEHVLYIRTRNYHWNVTGMHFKSLHEFFEEQYKALEAAIDEIAERARSLGFRAIGSMSEFMQHARLPEQNPAEVPDAVQMLRNLLADHESIIKHLRTDIDACDDVFEDVGTGDFLTGMMEAHEKMAWMIRAYLS